MQITKWQIYYKKGLTPLMAGAIAIVALLIGASAARANYYHDLQRNAQSCNDCHTQHYSEEGGTPPGVDSGGPFDQALISSTTNNLCLFCHDGSDPNAPDVLGPVTMYNGSGDETSGAGFFAGSGLLNINGHDLGVNTPVVPFSSMTNVTLTCASCHDPHGTDNYRNVLTTPNGGTGIPVIMGTDVFRNLPPSDPPSIAASTAAYRRSNEGYKTNTSLWCAECHDQLKPTNNNAHNRIHHFSDDRIDSGANTDPLHWTGGTGSGFGSTTGDGVEGVPRLRFQVSTATDFATANVAAISNEVVCGSCHLVHGGSYQKGLIWPYLEAGAPADANSGCQQCHNF